MNAAHEKYVPAAGLHKALRLQAEMFGPPELALAVVRGAPDQAAFGDTPDITSNRPYVLSGVIAPFGGAIVTTSAHRENRTKASIRQSRSGTQGRPKGDDSDLIVTDWNFIGSSGGNNVQSTRLTRKGHD